ncbi:MAG: PIN domain-containing protein [Terriglobales bacterium]
MLNLDTHILVQALQDELTPAEHHLLARNSWSVSAIVLWELAKLAQKGRISIDLSSPDFTRALARIYVWPLDLKICRTSTELDFKSDPADEIIAATSIVHKLPLVTRDEKILGSRLVPFPA